MAQRKMTRMPLAASLRVTYYQEIPRLNRRPIENCMRRLSPRPEISCGAGVPPASAGGTPAPQNRGVDLGQGLTHWSLHFARFCPLFAFLAVLLLALASAPARAAGFGPENVLLVINFRSPESLAVANQYVALRHIPPCNFLFLDWDPKQDTTDVATFREKILAPVVRAARLPVPGRRIDCVAYSAGFPWGIRIDDDIKKFTEFLEQHRRTIRSRAASCCWIKFMTPMASINGLTYLYEPVLAGIAALLRHPAQQLLRPHRSARAEPRAQPEFFQRVGLRPARRGERRFGPALPVVDGAGRHLRPRQHAGRSADLPPPQRRGRRHASPRHDLLRAKQRRPLEGPPGRLRRGREAAQGPGRGGRDRRRHAARRTSPTCKARCWAWPTSIGNPPAAPSGPARSASILPASAA